MKKAINNNLDINLLKHYLRMYFVDSVFPAPLSPSINKINKYLEIESINHRDCNIHNGTLDSVSQSWSKYFED